MPLLLAEFCPVQDRQLPGNFDPYQLTIRHSAVTVVLKEMLVPFGWHHGGINE